MFFMEDTFTNLVITRFSWLDYFCGWGLGDTGVRKSQNQMTCFLHLRNRWSTAEPKGKQIMRLFPVRLPYPRQLQPEKAVSETSSLMTSPAAFTGTSWFLKIFIFLNVCPDCNSFLWIFCLAFQNQLEIQAAKPASPVFSQLSRDWVPVFILICNYHTGEKCAHCWKYQNIPVARPILKFIASWFICFQFCEYFPE
jgi:hypothetical protein